MCLKNKNREKLWNWSKHDLETEKEQLQKPIPYLFMVTESQENDHCSTPLHLVLVSVCRNTKAERQASWEDHASQTPAGETIRCRWRQPEKYLRSLPAVSHESTTVGHSSQTARILWGLRWLVRSLNFILWNILNSFGHFREIRPEEIVIIIMVSIVYSYKF